MANVYVITGGAGSGKTHLAVVLADGLGDRAVLRPGIETSKNIKEDIRTACDAAGDRTVIFTMLEYMNEFDDVPHTRLHVTSRREK